MKICIQHEKAEIIKKSMTAENKNKNQRFLTRDPYHSGAREVSCIANY